MKRVVHCWIGIAMVSAWLAAPPARAAAVRTVTLKNGLTVIVAPDSLSPAADVAMWYRAGTLYEKAGTAGVAQLVERLMMRGAGVAEGARRIQAEGGTSGTQTTYDYACFYSTVPAEALDAALDLEARRMKDTAIDPEVFATERQSLADALTRRAEPNPVRNAVDLLYQRAFPDHAYGRSLTGAADLARVTIEDTRAFRARYVPGQAVLTIVGRVDSDAAVAAVRRLFEAVPSRPVSASRGRLAPAAQTAERHAGAGPGAAVPMMVVGWRAPGAAEVDATALQLLGVALAGGPQAILNSGTGTDRFILTDARLESRKEASLFQCVVFATSTLDSAAVRQKLLGDIDRLAKEPLAADDLERIKRQLEGATLLGWQTTRARAASLGTAQLVAGDVRRRTPDIARLKSLSAADLQSAAAALFRDTNRTLVWVRSARPTRPEGTRQ